MTNSLFWSPLANFFHINASQTGSLISSNRSKPFLSSMFRALVQGWGYLEGIGSTPSLKDPIRDSQAAQAMGPQNLQVVGRGWSCRTGLGCWQQQAWLTAQRHGRRNAPWPLRDLPTELLPGGQCSVFIKLLLCTRSGAGDWRCRSQPDPSFQEAVIRKKTRWGNITSATNSG